MRWICLIFIRFQVQNLSEFSPYLYVQHQDLFLHGDRKVRIFSIVIFHAMFPNLLLVLQQNSAIIQLVVPKKATLEIRLLLFSTLEITKNACHLSKGRRIIKKI